MSSTGGVDDAKGLVDCVRGGRRHTDPHDEIAAPDGVTWTLRANDSAGRALASLAVTVANLQLDTALAKWAKAEACGDYAPLVELLEGDVVARECELRYARYRYLVADKGDAWRAESAGKVVPCGA